MSVRRTLARVRALLGKQRLDQELEDEIRAHIELAEQDALERGLSREEARRDALRRFGGVTKVTEEHRSDRSLQWIETLLRDFRYGLSYLWRAPGFSLVVVSMLGLGIAGTVAMFSVIEGVLLKPLPFPDPDRIVRVWESPRPGTVNATTAGQFEAWKRSSTVLDSLAAEQYVSASLNGKEGPARLIGRLVTPEYFQVFGVTTAFGRMFSSSEAESDAASDVILSYAAWQTYFGADSNILKHKIIFDGSPCQVIGVLRPGAFDRDEVKFWRPLIFTSEQMSSSMHSFTLYGRLRSGPTLQQARQNLQAVYGALQGKLDEVPGGSIEVRRLVDLLVGPNLRRSVTVAFGSVLVVLLIACANVANLLFTRGAARRVELAVRAALGAGRFRLISQLLTECLALCVLGGVVGVVIAWLLIKIAAPVLFVSLPFTADLTLDARVLWFAAAVVLGVTLLVGILPGYRASSGDLAESLKQAARGSSTTSIRARRVIVTAEVALSLILLSGSLLLARSLAKLEQFDTGVRIESIVTASLNLPEGTYPTAQKAALFCQTLSERLRAQPGLAKVGAATFLPLRWIMNGEGIFIPGVEKQVLVRLKRVDPGYFEAFDIPLLSGRSIAERDREGTPRVMVINQALAARLAQVAGIRNPVGRVVRLTSGDYLARQDIIIETQIVGVIRSERTTSPGDTEPPVVYVPLAQLPNPDINLVVRSEEKPAVVIQSMRKALHEIDPNLPLADVATMEEVRADTFSAVSRPARLIGAFASIALALSAIGLYGVVSYSVTQRRRELGIRIALGARRSEVLWEIVRGALAVVGVGLVFGLAGVFAFTRILRNLLFEVSPLDPLALAVACLAMLLIGLIGSIVPALRAARFDPVLILRDAG